MPAACAARTGLQLGGEDAADRADDDQGGDGGQHHQAQVPAPHKGHNLRSAKRGSEAEKCALEQC